MEHQNFSHGKKGKAIKKPSIGAGKNNSKFKYY